jgi:hypothetical protein
VTKTLWSLGRRHLETSHCANWSRHRSKHHGSGLFDPVVRDIDPANAIKGMFGFDFLCAK